jgi:hypothetical protein
MRKLNIVHVMLLLGLALTMACSGDDGVAGTQGPAGGDGTPQPIKVLIAGVESAAQLQQRAALLSAGLPVGTTLNFVSLQDSLPSVAHLNQYDAVLCYSQFPWDDVPGGNGAVDMGDNLADYVDAGGGVVLAQGCFLAGTFELMGRIITDAGYSPFTAAAANGETGDRTLELASLDFPLHSIFTGVDLDNLFYEGGTFLNNPPLSADGTLLVSNVNGHNAVAINPAGNIIGTNIWISGTFGDPTEVLARKLLANMLLFVGGGIPGS